MLQSFIHCHRMQEFKEHIELQIHTFDHTRMISIHHSLVMLLRCTHSIKHPHVEKRM